MFVKSIVLQEDDIIIWKLMCKEYKANEMLIFVFLCTFHINHIKVGVAFYKLTGVFRA